MKCQIKNILKNNVCKILSTFVFVFMCSCIILPVHAFATSEIISGKLTLELVSNGGDSIIPIDASTTSSTGAFDFLPVILAIFALGLFVVFLYSLFTGKFKNKTLSIFALCLVVSTGVCGTKTLIANADNVGVSDNQGISSSAYLKFDEAGKVLENKLDITNTTDSTINIENITCKSEYASIFPDLAGIRITGNSSYEGKLNCDVVPASLIEKAKESQGKAEIEGFFSVNFNKEEPIPTGEAYAYKDTSNNEETTLVFAYDNEKSTHDAVYEIPDHPTQASSWAWDGERDVFTQVKVNEDFKHYSGLTSTSYMFYNFKNVSTIEGFENLNASNVTNMACMFQSFGYMSTIINSVPDVSEWNTSQVTDVNSMFYNYGYSSKVLSSAPDVSKWDTTNITSIYAMFYRYGYSSLSLNSAPDMSQWSTSKITDMSSMFFDYGYKSNLLQASPNMSNIDTSGVANMSYMFYDYGYSSKALNAVPDVLSWNISKVTDMSFMFYNYAQSSTSLDVVPEVKNWDTSNVENMSSMFYGFGGSSATLNAVPDVSSWNTSKLTYITYMFNNYGNKSPLLNEAPKVEDWDTSNVTSMSFMFAGYGEKSSAINAVPNVSKWNTSQVTDMSYMFCNYASGVQIESLDISGFDTKSVTNCNRMLSGIKLKSITLGVNFNLDLSSSEGHLTNSTGVQDATWYDMEGVGYEKCCMGKGARADVTTYYDTNPSPTLAEAYAYKDTTNDELATLVLAYDNAKSSHTDKGQTIYTIPTDALDKKSWGWDDERIAFKKIKINLKFKYYSGINSTACMFANFENVKEFEGFENLNTSNVTNMLSMFAGFNYSSKDFDVVPDISSWDTSKVTNMSYMFYGYGYSSSSLNTIPDLSNWNTTNVTDMSCMFSGYGHDSNTLNSVPDVSSWDVSNTSDISYMFYTYGYTSATLNKVPDTLNWKTTSLTNVSSMFRSYGYTSSDLTVVPAVSKWDTSKTTDMSYTFYAYGYTSTSLNTAPDLQGWNTPLVKDMSCMFTDYGTQSVISELNLSCFNTANMTSFSRMLSGVKLKSITLGTNFNLDLTTSGANLTNSKGDTNATWYSGTTAYENCGMGKSQRSAATTYTDTMQSVSSGTNENTLTNDTSMNQDSDNISNIQDAQKASTLNQDTNQDNTSSADTDTKDKAADNNTEDKDTDQIEIKDEEVESNFSVFLYFKSSINSFFNIFKLPFV